MKIFLTGGTGFLGKRIAKDLVKRGHQVTCQVRENSDVADLKLLPVRLVKGDVKDYDSLVKNMQGQAALIHAAGMYKLGPVDVKEMREVNVSGTENALLAAIKVKTTKIIYCGPALDTSRQSSHTVKSPAMTPASGTAYEKTKAVAQEKVVNFVKQGAPIVQVSPARLYGPGDPHFLGQYIKSYVTGKLPVGLNLPIKLNLVHVDDAAKGVVDALEKGRPGQNYRLGGEEVTWEQFLFLLENLSGINQPAINVGPKIAKLIGYAAEITAKITKRTPKLSVESIDQLSRNLIFNNNQAKLELGWQSRPLSLGLRQTIEAHQKFLA